MSSPARVKVSQAQVKRRLPATAAFPKNVGKIIAAARDELGMKQAELAKGSGIELRSLQNLENEKHRNPLTIRAVADFLNARRRERDWPEILVPEDTGPVKAGNWLTLPERAWDPKFCGPASLLNAEFEVVTFHGKEREEEVAQLMHWCRSGASVSLRVYKGSAGMGKTRLALELCRCLRRLKQELWTVGFVEADRVPLTLNPWLAVCARNRPVLIVLDYAGEKEKTPVICHLLRHLPQCPASRVRLLFLDRDDLWLGRLYDDKAARAVLNGSPVVRDEFRVELKPVAATKAEREFSFVTAIHSFCGRLGVPVPETIKSKLAGELFNQVLFIHSQALLGALGTKVVTGEQQILRHLLHREREYWSRMADALNLDRQLLPAIEEAVYAVSLNNGAANIAAAKKIFRKTDLLRDQPDVVLHRVAMLLRECYPGRGPGIAPLQPDRLRDFLAEEFLGRGAAGV